MQISFTADKQIMLLEMFLKSKKAYNKCVKNMKKSHSDFHSLMGMKDVGRDVLWGVFDWGVSPEGHDYWSGICHEWESFYDEFVGNVQ